MKHFVLVLLLMPVLAFSQSKKKKRIAQEKADAQLMTDLQYHVSYLADDKLEGRRTGTPGEKLAMEYIIKQYQQINLQPAGNNGYVQEFEINEGKSIGSKTYLKLHDKNLIAGTDFTPLAFSPNVHIKGMPAMILQEKGQPWFLDLRDLLEENKINPHFDIEDELKKLVDAYDKKGATALFVYNTSKLTDNVLFNKNDKSATTKIPVVYIDNKCYNKYFTDNAATLDIDLNIAFEENKRTAHNVVGFINNNATNTIVLGAHYDHLGYGEDKNALDTAHSIHNGADDNASGTAALIELAKMLKKSAPVNNNYLIVNFSGEELGLFGSKYWLEHPTTNITANYMINMDMVGRYDTAHKLTIGGYGTSPVWSEVFTALPNKDLIVKFDSSGSGPSDHSSFYRANIPVLFFFTGSHSDYHKTTDDWDKINYKAEKDIVQYIYQIIQITDSKGKLAFLKTAEQQVGKVKMKVTLGIMPDYGYTGTGVRIDGISPGKTAEKIGLQAGDILLQLGDYKFVDVMSYMTALGKFNKGEKVKLKYKRKDEEKEIDLEL